ncbi:Mut7-C RNAse domain-containing protein [Halostella litorea]|uniref:Mut7-C RNAse domain-containing protein n=1 Tax=Halostella litorea TaxID=2528831 RepID=UPI0010922575|nr:Mut7-C RNAse domain-containing protein [Halostella litorea]
MRLLLDAMCGGVRAHLRMCGHDAAYALDRGVEADDALLRIARDEDRTLVTRDAALAGRAADAVRLDATDVDEQLRELRDAGVPLTLPDEPERCGACNGPLARTEGSTPDYAPDPADVAVWRCRDCGRCFWKGSHWDRVAATLAAMDG